MITGLPRDMCSPTGVHQGAFVPQQLQLAIHNMLGGMTAQAHKLWNEIKNKSK